jgi:acetylornithine deacetylase/succinyl-diaminopimelate desuccinylase-like protein
MNRRELLKGAALTTAAMAMPRFALTQAGGNADLEPIFAEITKAHDENIKRIQTWIHQPSIAAENRGVQEGCELTMQMLRDAGFQSVTKIPTDGLPGIFATLDGGAPRTLGLYFMYDVKQVDPSEWSSPPWDAALVDKPGFGKVMMGRGAVNQKGPEATFLSALHAIQASGRKLPCNLVLIAEGEEEIGSPHFPQIVHRPEVMEALKKVEGIFMPSASQNPDGTVLTTLGAKGVIEAQLVSSGEKWGRGPTKDIHSSLKARVDSPAWHLVKALSTLVSEDGNTPLVAGFAAKARPLSATEKQMCQIAATRLDEQVSMKQLGVTHWIHDVPFEKSLEMLMGDPTINIEGLVGGYTGPGGKTILPHQAQAKLDIRLVPDMTASDTLQKMKDHLAKHGYADIEVTMSGGYDPTSTPADARIIRVEETVYKRAGIDPIILPRNAGSWPGYVFTGEPLGLPAGHFGLGHGSGAHAPDEYYVIESTNPRVQGLDGAVRSYVEYVYEFSKP